MNALILPPDTSDLYLNLSEELFMLVTLLFNFNVSIWFSFVFLFPCWRSPFVGILSFVLIILTRDEAGHHDPAHARDKLLTWLPDLGVVEWSHSRTKPQQPLLPPEVSIIAFLVQVLQRSVFLSLSPSPSLPHPLPHSLPPSPSLC